MLRLFRTYTVIQFSSNHVWISVLFNSIVELLCMWKQCSIIMTFTIIHNNTTVNLQLLLYKYILYMFKEGVMDHVIEWIHSYYDKGMSPVRRVCYLCNVEPLNTFICPCGTLWWPICLSW